MSSRVRRCGGCGGPLSEAADDRGTITCAFCGMVNEVSAPTPQPIVIRVDAGRQIVRTGGGIALAIGFGAMLMIAGIGVVLYRAARPASSALGVEQRSAAGA